MDVEEPELVSPEGVALTRANGEILDKPNEHDQRNLDETAKVARGLPDGLSYDQSNDALVHRLVVCEAKLERLNTELFVHNEYDSIFDALVCMETEWLLDYRTRLAKAKVELDQINKHELEVVNNGINTALSRSEDQEAVSCASQELQVKGASKLHLRLLGR